MKYKKTICPCGHRYIGIVCNICKKPSDLWKSVKERK